MLDKQVQHSVWKSRLRPWRSTELTMRHPSIHKKLTLASPTSGGRSARIVRSRTKATKFLLLIIKQVEDFMLPSNATWRRRQEVF
jgi:hypothetical protein